MNIKLDKETGTVFDDFTKNDEKENFDKTFWTQVCDSCANDHKLPKTNLDIDSGHGICGVLGCNNQSDHYYDFNTKKY